MIRFDALLSRFGYCSRREALSWAKAGRGTLNGQAITSVKQKVNVEDVLIDGEPVEFPHGIYVALNKPLGYTCSRSEAEGDVVEDLLPHSWTLRNPIVTTVGRLDKETSGLLLITDDGAFVHRMTSPKRHLPKVYAVETELPIPVEAVSMFASGEFLLEGERTPCLPAELEILEPQKALLTLHEGRYHQVRRMLAQVGAPVTVLTRISIGKLKLEDLKLEPGDWVEIDPANIEI